MSEERKYVCDVCGKKMPDNTGERITIEISNLFITRPKVYRMVTVEICNSCNNNIRDTLFKLGMKSIAFTDSQEEIEYMLKVLAQKI